MKTMTELNDMISMSRAKFRQTFETFPKKYQGTDFDKTPEQTVWIIVGLLGT